MIIPWRGCCRVRSLDSLRSPGMARGTVAAAPRAFYSWPVMQLTWKVRVGDGEVHSLFWK